MNEQDAAKAGELETWAIVEIFGHKKLAGFVRSVPMGGAVMIRVDVPAIKEETEEYEQTNYDERDEDGRYKKEKKSRLIPAVPGFTQFLGVSSVFSLTPCTEEAAMYLLKRWRPSPNYVLDAPRALPSPDDFETADQYD